MTKMAYFHDFELKIAENVVKSKFCLKYSTEMPKILKIECFLAKNCLKIGYLIKKVDY